MAFFGGLGDLLATAAMGDWTAADEILHSPMGSAEKWKPTLGTRAAGPGLATAQVRPADCLLQGSVFSEFRTDAAPISEWTFPGPMGTQPVVGEFTMADAVTIARHLKIPAIRSYMTVAAVKGLSDPDLTPPEAIDGSGRSAQTFLVSMSWVRSGGIERRAVASGQDIYAISAPLVVEATERVVGRQARKVGAVTAGEAFDARDFLNSLCPELSLTCRSRCHEVHATRAVQLTFTLERVPAPGHSPGRPRALRPLQPTQSVLDPNRRVGGRARPLGQRSGSSSFGLVTAEASGFSSRAGECFPDPGRGHSAAPCGVPSLARAGHSP